MLKEITLKEACELMEGGQIVYAVNLDTQERQLVDLTNLFEGIRILADLPQEKKARRGRRPKTEEIGEEEITDLAEKIDTGKIKALQRAGWRPAQIADEFGYTVPVMERILKKLE